MSAQGDPSKAELSGDGWRGRSSRKRPRSRPYLIEWRSKEFNQQVGANRWGAWTKFSAYETEKKRDAALEQKQKSDRPYFQYRAAGLKSAKS